MNNWEQWCQDNFEIVLYLIVARLRGRVPPDSAPELAEEGRQEAFRRATELRPWEHGVEPDAHLRNWLALVGYRHVLGLREPPLGPLQVDPAIATPGVLGYGPLV